MEHVELMQGHDVERLLHFVDREEMAADVEHHAPVAQARFVLDRHDGQLHGPHVGRTVSRSGDQLAEGLHRIERPGCTPGNNLRTPGRNLQAVAIRRHRRVARDIQRPVEGHVGMPHPQPFAEHRFQHFVERPGHTGQTVVARQQHRFGRSGQQKGSLPFHDTFGERHHRDFIVGGDYLTAAAEGRTEDNEEYKSLHIGLVLNGVAQEHKVKIRQKTDKSKPRPVIRTPKPPAAPRVRPTNSRYGAVRPSWHTGTV